MKALALIIGNSKYESDDLVTPVNDAEDLSEKLHKLGFIVKKEVNVDIDQFNRLVDGFGSDLNSFNVGLFYFAGHGLQIDGDNYLTATNTNFESENAAKYSSFTLYKLLDYMDKAKNETNIIILDACRNNPFERKWSRGIKQKGLAPLHAPKGTFISFATSPGETALNGIGRNGLFTGMLLNQLEEPNIQIEELFKRVRNAVYDFSKGKQTTWEHTSLTGKFIFNSGYLMQHTGSQYSDESIADENYISSGAGVDVIIDQLKSHNWYTQGPAISRIATLNPIQLDKNKLFLLGRNILQTATGGEWAAEEFIKNIANKAPRFAINNENHLLNGILFEIYFDSKGRFRGKNLKDRFLKELISVEGNSLFKTSFDFISEQLAPFSDYIIYTPSSNDVSLSLSITLDKITKDDVTEYKVIDIKHEGNSLFVKEEDSWFNHFDNEPSYQPFIFRNFKLHLADLLKVPIGLLNISTNFELDDWAKILYPFGYALEKGKQQ